MPKIIFTIALLILNQTLLAQKVAVVMSGGGAKGLAHIGVLKALEEKNIPVDYVVGTSMGGVVAGCYAAGYSPDEIEYLFLHEDFMNWINGTPEKGFNYDFYKKDENSSMLSIRLALDSTLHAQINSTIAKDLSLNFALAEKLAQPSATAEENFDSLFVPLRVVASEVFTQQTVVLKRGSLNSALRATLSVPFFYKPIKIDGRYLFDGGIYNNFPTDIAKEEFNPDFIIGVNVSSKVFEEYPHDEDDKLISNSLFYMLLDKSDPKKLDENSIYIEPDLTGYSSFDFIRARALIDSGYNATMKLMPQILAQINVRDSCETLVKRRNAFNNSKKPLLFSDVKVYDFNERQEKFIKKLFRPKKKPYITLSEIKEAYFRLMAEPYFQTVYPDISYNESTDSYTFEIHGRPKNDLNIQLGGNLSTRNISAIFLAGEFYYFNSFLLNTSFNFYGGNFYKSAQLKSRFYFPGIGHWYLEPEITLNYWDFLNIKDILVDQKNPTILDRSDRTYGLTAALPMGNRYKIQVSGAYIYNKDEFSNSNSIGIRDTLDFMNIRGLKNSVEISYNSLNDKMYPTHGKYFRVSGFRYGLIEDYVPGTTSDLEVNIEQKHSWYKGELQLEQYYDYGDFSAGYLFKGVISNQPSFASEMGSKIYLPAFYPLIDSRTLFLDNFRSSTYLAAGIRTVFDFKKDFQFRLDGYAFKGLGAVVNNQEANEMSQTHEPVRLAASGAFIYDSPIGPLSLNLNYYDEEKARFGILLNFGYLLFNKPAIE